MDSGSDSKSDWKRDIFRHFPRPKPEEVRRRPLAFPALAVDGATWEAFQLLHLDSLCKRCSRLKAAPTESNWDVVSRKINTQGRKKSLEEGTGCPCCEAVEQTLLCSGAAILEQGDSIVLDVVSNPFEIGVHGLYRKEAVFRHPWETMVYFIGKIYIRKVTDIDGSAMRLATALGVPGHVLSRCISFAQQQLENCEKNPHHNCKPQGSVRAQDWPSRILSISDETVSLVAFDSSTMKGRYTALSYCWGDKAELQERPNLKTTSTTLASMEAGFAISDLPLTLGQAVLVSTCLDMKYIWIDSLCIIQDDPSDWETEAAKMETVYAMSSFTIIAAACTSSHSGLFLDKHSPQPLHPNFSQTTSIHLHVNALGDHLDGFHRYPPLEHIDHRGWTYQEEYLSTRHLKFTAADVQWKCSAGAICLCSSAAPAYGYELEWAMKDWDLVVRNFTTRKFTNMTDKLPAMSGLAARFAAEKQQQDNPATYIAGCWEDEIRCLRALHWRRDFDDPNLGGLCEPSPEPYIAPSFVWASVNGPIFFQQPSALWEMRKPLGKVLKVEVQVVAPKMSPFGHVSGGSLTLQAPTVRWELRIKSCAGERISAQLVPNLNSIYMAGEELDWHHDSCYLDYEVAECTSSTGERSLHRCPGPVCRLASDPRTKHRSLIDLTSSNGRSCAEVDVVFLTMENLTVYTNLTCLVLGRGDPESTVYQRIGFGEVCVYRLGLMAQKLDALMKVVTIQ